jgi:hypothetical protein
MCGMHSAYIVTHCIAKLVPYCVAIAFTFVDTKCESECDPDGVTYDESECESECVAVCDTVCVADVVS